VPQWNKVVANHLTERYATVYEQGRVVKAKRFNSRRIANDEASYRELAAITRSAPNGELADVERAIASFEREFGMTSAEAHDKLARGELAPTREIEGWMMALRIRDHLVGAQTRSH